MGKAFKQSDMWLLQLDELEWYGIPKEAQDALKDDMLLQAGIEGCILVAILVDPDPVFPMFGHTTRHRVFEQRLERKLAVPFQIETKYTCEINSDEYWVANESTRMKMVGKARDALNECGLSVPGRYQIVVRVKDGQELRIIEAGRV